jgi:hypothetical protein
VNAIVSHIALAVMLPCHAQSIKSVCKCKTAVYFMLNRTDTNIVVRTMLC